MQTKSILFRNITLAALLASTVILFLGCQKHDGLSEQDVAMANADRSAQAAQAATDAATAAVPVESAVTTTASAASETSSSTPLATKATS
jgi:hypothetical protein